jgi:lysophospholipase
MGTASSISILPRSFTAADGTPLRADYYSDRPRASRGIVVVVHGYCEHRGRYRHVAEHLVQQGYAVLVGDLRGHGESSGERGFIRRFSEYLDDVTAFLVEAQSQYSPPSGKHVELPTADVDAPQRPILLGHSLGGLIALEYVLANPTTVRALALSSPFLGIKVHVPAWKRGAGLVASLVHPTLRLPNGLDARDISHDPEIVQQYATDPMITHDATARWFTEITSTHADIRARANRVRTPCLFLQAGDDRIVDANATQQVFSRLGTTDKTLNVYPGLFHEIFNERPEDRQRVLTDLTNWLNER